MYTSNSEKQVGYEEACNGVYSQIALLVFRGTRRFITALIEPASGI
jgi:hypothetical protein